MRQVIPGAGAPRGRDRLVNTSGYALSPQQEPVEGYQPEALAWQSTLPAQAGGGTYAAGAVPPSASTLVAASEADEGAYRRASTDAEARDDDLSLNDLLCEVLERGASDLHLTSGAAPTIRLNGELTPIEGKPLLSPPMLQRVLYAALTQKQRERFEEELELDFSYSVPGKARFRVNIYRQRESLGAAFRVIPFEIKPLEDLGVPPSVANFAMLARGFVLVTGPTGSGKSTTLASLIDLANRQRRDHIMTVEDPIEFLHRHKSSLINQREIGEDTKSFTNALKHVLRQDPDIILVGEMRDLETISVALTAAETGHLVFATLHTQDAAQTIDRVIDVFPPHQQQQVRVQLSGALQGVVCQTLCKTRDGRGRVVATEVLVATPAIRNLIREGKTHQIYSAMQAGAQHGMHTLDQHLADLVNRGKVTYEHGLEKCHHVADFNRLTGRG
jgi:twitching motility protein PilT